MNRDLTVGKPESVLWRFCLPLFGSVIFQQLYNIADSFVAGRYIGENALAAVGNSYEITLIFIAFAFGCNIGCSVIVSQMFGAKKYDDMKTAIWTTLIASAALVLCLMAAGFALGGSLLELISTPDELMADSLVYLNIYILGVPFLLFYNVATGIFSALGDSRTPFVFLAVSSVSNVAVDILFVKAFGMGVSGVAWATFLCQGVSAVLALIVVFRRLAAIPTCGHVKIFSASMLKKIAIIAVPSILQQSFISVGNIIIQRVINGFGASVIAGYAAAVKLNNLVITSFTTLGNGISNYTAQNLGAGRTDRIRCGFSAGLKLVWGLCIPFAVLYFFFGKYGMYPFMENRTGLALDTGITYLRILSPFYFVVSAKLVADGILRGMGLMGRFMASTFTDLILRVALAVILSDLMASPVGIWMAWPIGWSAATVMSVVFCLRGIKGTKKRRRSRKMRFTPVRLVLCVFGALGAVVFLLPVIAKGNVNIGTVAGVSLCTMVLMYGLFAARVNTWFVKLWQPKWGKAVCICLMVCVFFALALASVITACMVKAAHKSPEENSTVVVLGCAVRGNSPSIMLRERLQAAEEYLTEHPQSPCVVTGGQGADESMSEAQCMYDYLVGHGIDASRIYMEDQATSTRENISFSQEVIEQNNLPGSMAIVTNEFHEYRAVRIADKLGITAGAVPGATDWWLLPTYYVREMAGILYEWISELL